MLVQRLVILANSCALSVDWRIAFSVVLKAAPNGWIVVPKPNEPLAINGFAAFCPATAALFVQVDPTKPAPAPVGTTFTITEFGLTPVSVLEIISAFTDRETKPFGVTRHEQQEISCSSGEKA